MGLRRAALAWVVVAVLVLAGAAAQAAGHPHWNTWRKDRPRGPVAARGEDIPPPIRVAQAATNPGAADDVDLDELDDFEDDFEDEFAEEEIEVSDPLEPINRATFWVNDKLYFYVFKPAVHFYRAIVPEPARIGVSNFFYNVATPIRMTNALLQTRTGDALTEMFRFLINTTVGIGGIFDPARTYGGIERTDEDLGQTLGVYGVGPGIYIVLPLLGPSNVRDTVGLVGDSFLDPWTYITRDRIEYVQVKVVDKATWLSLDKDTYEGIVEQAIDPYLDVRNGHAQLRAARISALQETVRGGER